MLNYTIVSFQAKSKRAIHHPKSENIKLATIFLFNEIGKSSLAIPSFSLFNKIGLIWKLKKTPLAISIITIIVCSKGIPTKGLPQ